MNFLANTLQQLHLSTLLPALALIILGFLTAKMVSSSLRKVFAKRFTEHQSMVVCRIAYYLILLLFIASSVQQLGFHIGALLGATGILTVALGIASQTSLSNIISGVFMIGEKSLQLGDHVKINDVQGYVHSVDWLSVKIRTQDNTLVRIPNEVLIKSAIINISYFPNRRIDLLLTISYKDSIEQVTAILLALAKANPHVVKNTEPLLLMLGLHEGGMQLQFSLWAQQNDFNSAKNRLLTDIKEKFIAAGIDMPAPTRTLFAGNPNHPFSIKIIS